MANNSSSSSSQSSGSPEPIAPSTGEGKLSPANANLLESVISLLAEDLAASDRQTQEVDKELKSAAPSSPISRSITDEDSNGQGTQTQQQGLKSQELKPQGLKPQKLDGSPPQLSVVVANQAQRSPQTITPPSPSPQLPDPDPPQISSAAPSISSQVSQERSRVLVSRSAINQHRLSNTTERLLNLQLRVLNTLLKLQETKTRPQPSAVSPPQPLPPPPQSWVDRLWTQFKMGIMVTAVALAGLGGHHWLTSGDRQVQQRLTNTLSTDPELSVYRLQSRIEDGQVILSGRVPTATLQQSAVTVAKQIAPEYAVRNEVLVVQLPPTDQTLQSQVDQLLAIANEGNTLRSQGTVKNQTVTLTGTVESDAIANRLVARLKQMPGITGVRDQLKRQPQAIATRLYFYAQSADVLSTDLTSKLRPIADQLKAHPQWTLEIIGHQHSGELSNPEDSGTSGNQGSLALRRAIATRSRLEDMGIDRRRLTAIASPKPPTGTDKTEPFWTQQVVMFNLQSGAQSEEQSGG